ncbi:MAG TPA: sigma 54-interacting transcriptional regulator [Polyangiaceae bacterium]|nr:sigma 54-interacting transcriptional regulator [Polyangiaceae bacterium]
MQNSRRAAPDPAIGRVHTTLISARRADLRPLPVLVRCAGAPARPNPLRLLAQPCVLGAGSEADMVIDADTASRRHAELASVPEGVLVTDLGSKNGLFYLGQRFQSMVLQPGSRFQLGSVEIELDIDAETLSGYETGDPESYGDLIGVSPAMRQLFNQLVRLEGSKVNVLVVGETGTGKELVARALHEHSPARRGPLVCVNCGALDRSLVRSELFGHQRGAFTGATHANQGAFVAAHGGTLFLDEVAELPLDVQPVLLRALELRRVSPVGGHGERDVDVRVITATHRDLRAEVAAGRFREDLFYRVQVVRLDVPPLRERPEDIPVLAAHIARQQGVSSLPADFLDAIVHHGWPGNVRELRNAVEAYLAIGAVPRGDAARGGAVDDALFDFIDPSRAYADQKNEVLERFTRVYLERLLEKTKGNQSEAARLSGLERSYLGKLVTKLGLRRS